MPSMGPAFVFSFEDNMPIDAAVWLWPLLFICTFLLGSIPWGVIISKLAFNKDIRDEGSGNIGATNALRTMGKSGGVSVLLLDIAKGVASGFLGIFVTSLISIDETWLVFAPMGIGFLGCVLGHIFSPWLGFKGGKSISVAFGYLFLLFGPLGALLDLVVFLIFVISTRYVSLGSIMAAFACSLIGLYCYWEHWLCVCLIVVPVVFVIWAHRSNIDRLLHRSESKLSFKKEKSTK